jgi:hypothetical protein
MTFLGTHPLQTLTGIILSNPTNRGTSSNTITLQSCDFGECFTACVGQGELQRARPALS